MPLNFIMPLYWNTCILMRMYQHSCVICVCSVYNWLQKWAKFKFISEKLILHQNFRKQSCWILFLFNNKSIFLIPLFSSNWWGLILLSELWFKQKTFRIQSLCIVLGGAKSIFFGPTFSSNGWGLQKFKSPERSWKC